MRFSAPPTSRWSFALLGLILCLVLAGTSVTALLFLSPTRVSYTLEESTLQVHADLGPIDQGRLIQRAQIEDARAVPLRGGVRVAGTGLSGYCEGRWRYPELGVVWQATTCTPQGVVLETPDGRLVISPADPEAFVAALKGGEQGVFPAPMGESVGVLRWAVLVPFAILVILLGLFARIAKVEYRIEGQELLVPAHLRTLRVPLAGARVTRYGPARIWRVAGTGLPQLYLGLYRVDGRNMHVAATRTGEGVLIEGERPVWITPEDPDAFVAAALRAGARSS